jgi:hypothetical protein
VGVRRISKIRLGEKDSLGFGKDKTCVSLSPSSTRGNLRERESERESYLGHWGLNKKEMGQWDSTGPGPDVVVVGSAMGMGGGGRDVTNVLLSPLTKGTMSPKKRFPNPKCGEEINDPFKIYQYLTADQLEGGKESAAGMVDSSDVCLLKVSHHNTCSKLQGMEHAGFVSDLGHFLVRNSSVISQTFSKKRSYLQSSFYVFALLVLTFLFVKITSVGLLRVESQNYSATKVGFISSSCFYFLLHSTLQYSYQ